MEPLTDSESGGNNPRNLASSAVVSEADTKNVRCGSAWTESFQLGQDLVVIPSKADARFGNSKSERSPTTKPALLLSPVMKTVEVFKTLVPKICCPRLTKCVNPCFKRSSRVGVASVWFK